MSVVLNFRSHLSDLFAQAVRIVAPEVTEIDIVIERPKHVQHGDYACNLAMQLARLLRKAPNEIARSLITALPTSHVVEKVEIAGAGFINIFISRTNQFPYFLQRSMQFKFIYISRQT